MEGMKQGLKPSLLWGGLTLIWRRGDCMSEQSVYLNADFYKNCIHTTKATCYLSHVVILDFDGCLCHHKLRCQQRLLQANKVAAVENTRLKSQTWPQKIKWRSSSSCNLQVVIRFLHKCHGLQDKFPQDLFKDEMWRLLAKIMSTTITWCCVSSCCSVSPNIFPVGCKEKPDVFRKDFVFHPSNWCQERTPEACVCWCVLCFASYL